MTLRRFYKENQRFIKEISYLRLDLGLMNMKLTCHHTWQLLWHWLPWCAIILNTKDVRWRLDRSALQIVLSCCRETVLARLHCVFSKADVLALCLHRSYLAISQRLCVLRCIVARRLYTSSGPCPALWLARRRWWSMIVDVTLQGRLKTSSYL